jgi:4-hydroxybenzoate polyprenyltransferase
VRDLNPPRSSSLLDGWLSALRLHQWAKNLLVFVPLVLAGGLLTPGPLFRQLAGLVLIGVCASGAYILNDIRDLEADRAHPTKQLRPFADGRLAPRSGVIVAVVLILLGLTGAAALSPAFAAWVAVYMVGTLAYSMWLKRLAIVDVAALAGLYTLRLVMGAALAAVPLSEWLAIFAITFFFSLSVAKRHVEIVKAAAGAPGPIAGRGYRTQDAALTLTLGVAAAMTAFLVMVLFVVFQAFHQANYVRPEFLWSAPFLTFLWIARVWLFAARGELDDDPVVFALKDRVSLALGALVLASVLIAVRGTSL